MNQKAIIEGLLFLSGDNGMSVDEISTILNEDSDNIKRLIKELYSDYENINRGLRVEFIGNKFKLTTKKEHKEFYKKMVEIEENVPLSQSALETLAIIAYNGPITRAQIDEIRGVGCTYILRKLLIKNLIEDVGRSESPGKPILYNVTSNFLDYFGLGSIDELPELKTSEIEDTDETDLFKSKYTENDMQ